MSDIEGKLLLSIHENGEVKDSGEWANSAQVDHQALVGVIKSLMASELIVVEVRCRHQADLARSSPSRACRTSITSDTSSLKKH